MFWRGGVERIVCVFGYMGGGIFFFVNRGEKIGMIVLVVVCVFFLSFVVCVRFVCCL